MLDETIFNKSHIIGIDEVVKGVANHCMGKYRW